MEKNIYLAGVGGQGLQVVGKTIAEVANQMGYAVTYSPKYGPQKRGGLTSCYVVVSDGEIGNPRKNRQDLLLVMEPNAYASLHRNLRPGGVLVVNSTLVPDRDEPAPGTRRLDLPMHGCCEKLGNTRVISAVVMGALSGELADIFPDRSVLLDYMLASLRNKPELVELNRRAFEMGCALIENAAG